MAGFPLPLCTSSRDLGLIEKKHYDHEVAVAHTSFNWEMFAEVSREVSPSKRETVQRLIYGDERSSFGRAGGQGTLGGEGGQEGVLHVWVMLLDSTVGSLLVGKLQKP